MRRTYARLPVSTVKLDIYRAIIIEFWHPTSLANVNLPLPKASVSRSSVAGFEPARGLSLLDDDETLQILRPNIARSPTRLTLLTVNIPPSLTPA